MEKNQKDLASAALFFFAGLLIVILSLGYDTGTIRNMGPGFFPFVMGCIIIALSLIMLANGIASPGQTFPRFNARASLLVLLATLVFGLLLKPAGLVPAVFVAVAIGAAAHNTLGWRSAFITATLMSLLSAVLFITLLGQEMSYFGPWLR